MAKTSPVLLMRQVRQEARRVTWPDRKETSVSTAMVLVMVTLASTFFFVVDQLAQLGIRGILSLAG